MLFIDQKLSITLATIKQHHSTLVHARYKFVICSKVSFRTSTTHVIEGYYNLQPMENQKHPLPTPYIFHQNQASQTQFQNLQIHFSSKLFNFLNKNQACPSCQRVWEMSCKTSYRLCTLVQYL